jgi:hypothetical protein
MIVLYAIVGFYAVIFGGCLLAGLLCLLFRPIRRRFRMIILGEAVGSDRASAPSQVAEASSASEMAR